MQNVSSRAMIKEIKFFFFFFLLNRYIIYRYRIVLYSKLFLSVIKLYTTVNFKN